MLRVGMTSWHTVALMGLTDSGTNWATLHGPSVSVTGRSRPTPEHLADRLWTLSEDSTTSCEVQWDWRTDDRMDNSLSQVSHLTPLKPLQSLWSACNMLLCLGKAEQSAERLHYY